MPTNHQQRQSNNPRRYPYASLVLALLSASLQPQHVTANSHLRKGGETSEQQQHGRSLYGREFGLKGFQSLFSDVGFGKAQEELDRERNPGTSSEYVGPQVHFDDQEADAGSAFLGGFQPKVVGGTTAEKEQKAFTMHLRYDSTWQTWNFAGCGGTLISECHILTAAHCVSDNRAGLPNGVYVNAYAPFKGNEGKAYHFSLVEDVITHPDFDNSDNRNDIAIIEMKTCITDIEAFPPMRVATPEYMEEHVSTGTPLTVMGFGKLSPTDSTLTNYLQQAEVPYINSTICKSLYGADRIYDGDMFCAGNTKRGGVDACQGDSGGPLVMNATSPTPTVVGIVSWGTGCADKKYPGVYASTSYHLDFIQSAVCPHPLVASGSSQLCAPTIAAGGDYNNIEDGNESNPGNSSPPPKVTPVPTPPPTLSPTREPTPSPTPDCGLRYDFCLSNADCCEDMGLICHRYQCIRPSTGGGGASKQSLYDRRNRNNGD